MVKVNFYNEKGNVSAKVRNAMKAQTLTKLRSALVAAGMEDVPASLNECGGLSVPVALTLDGKPIYAHISLTISELPVKKSTPKDKSKAPKKEVDVDLFGD